MKTRLFNFFVLVPFFALLMITSCQEEELDVTTPDETTTIAAESELSSLLSAASSLDGSKDDIIDQASCVSVKLPVIVKIRGLEVRIDSEADFAKIRRLYDEFQDDVDRLDINFPITVISTEHEEFEIENAEALARFIAACKGQDNDDQDIRCIDFQFPLTFSVFDANAEVINTVEIENDRALHRFMKRVRNAEVVANLNFPVTMVLADGTTVVANSNEELRRIITNARRTCEVVNDRTRERLLNYLKRCPWVVFEFERDGENGRERFADYAINFKEDNEVTMRSREGDVLTGTWGLRRTRRGVLIKMEFETLADFTLEWLIADLEDGTIKIHEIGGNRIVLKRNCDVVVDITKERVENFLKTCLWRVERLKANNIENDREYIGTPLNFLDNNIVKIRVDGELIEGTYEVLVRAGGIGLDIDLPNRPNLRLQWKIERLSEDAILLVNENNQMLLRRHCPDNDEDFPVITRILTNGDWAITSFIDNGTDATSNYTGYVIAFNANGRLIAEGEGQNIVGSWLAFRKEGLNLGMFFRTQEAPFNSLTQRWKIQEIMPNKVMLKDLGRDGNRERLLVIEKREI